MIRMQVSDKDLVDVMELDVIWKIGLCFHSLLLHLVVEKQYLSLCPYADSK